MGPDKATVEEGAEADERNLGRDVRAVCDWGERDIPPEALWRKHWSAEKSQEPPEERPGGGARKADLLQGRRCEGVQAPRLGTTEFVTRVWLDREHAEKSQKPPDERPRGGDRNAGSRQGQEGDGVHLRRLGAAEFVTRVWLGSAVEARGQDVLRAQAFMKAPD